MRKYSPLYVFLILGLIILVFLFRNKFESFVSKENNFSISDTAAVSRIEIISKDSIILTRKGTLWIVNGEAPANQVAIDNFLFIFTRMSVRGINNNPEIREEKGLRLRIFSGRKKLLVRFYEIDGTAFMHKEGSAKLYAVDVNGFPEIKPGDIISSDPDQWKNRTLLDLRPGEISEICLIHPANPENDFIIKVSEGKPVLFDGNGLELPGNQIDKEKLNFYLTYFTNIFYDYTEKEELNAESVTIARWILKVTDSRGKKYELMVFPKKTIAGTDMFLGMVKFNNKPGFKVTRFLVLDLLLQNKGHFILKEFKD